MRLLVLCTKFKINDVRCSGKRGKILDRPNTPTAHRHLLEETKCPQNLNNYELLCYFSNENREVSELEEHASPQAGTGTKPSDKSTFATA